VNSNNGWLAEVTREIDPMVLAGTLNNVGEWMKELIHGIDPAVVAGAMDELTDLIEKVLDSLDPEDIIAVLNRLSRNRVLEQVTIQMAYEIPMRRQFMQGGVQLMGARRMDATRRPRATTTRVLPPSA